MSTRLDRSASVRHLLKTVTGEHLENPAITELSINRPHELWTHTSAWTQHPIDADYAHLDALSRAIARYSDKDINDTRPILSAVLPDGQRIQIVRPPACEHGTVSLSIRQPNHTRITLEQYRQQGFFDHLAPRNKRLTDNEQQLLELQQQGDSYQFLKQAVRTGQVIVIAGETHSGKTTLMKALVQEIRADERLITIEDVAELSLPEHPNHVHLFYHSDHGSRPEDTISATDLLRSALRMNPDRILLAELRGSETFDFINIAASGHKGSITSCHAGSCALAIERMALMLLQHPQARTLPYTIIRQLLLMSIDVIVHLQHDPGSKGRYISELWYDPQQKRHTAASA